MTTSLTKPNWAGAGPLSQLVNLAIRTPPLYALMKGQARAVLIRTAERNGVPWQQTVEELRQAKLASHLPQLRRPEVPYPAYYQVPFHAYPQGNLCWQAAFEAEPATQAMALRIWPQESLTWQEAQARLRQSFHDVLSVHGPETVSDILDMGCSVGISTRSIHQYYQRRQGRAVRTVGLDLSEYMLAVARHRDPAAELEWRHGAAEQTGLPAESVDLITLQFVAHELPQAATHSILREAFRLLRPGGCLAILDNNPRSPVIQNLPPVLFTLMKSTEPWSDEYYALDLEAAIAAAGLTPIATVASDPRHRTVIARKHMTREP